MYINLINFNFDIMFVIKLLFIILILIINYYYYLDTENKNVEEIVIENNEQPNNFIFNGLFEESGTYYQY